MFLFEFVGSIIRRGGRKRERERKEEIVGFTMAGYGRRNLTKVATKSCFPGAG